jgi:hypothetical protein
MRELRVVRALVLAGAWFFACAGAGCKKNDGAAPEKAASAPASASAPNPAFDQSWAALAKNDVDVFYIEDDRGEGLMGNVRRARGDKAPAATVAARPAGSALPKEPRPDEVQQVIRQNLAGVRACYLRMARTGDQRSGKAIVSFQIGPGGEVRDTRIDAPAFEGTSLPGCVSGMVSHWAFPKSQDGGLAISYPFVFVGG